MERALVSLTALQLRLGLLSKRSIFLRRDTFRLEELLQGSSLERASMELPTNPSPRTSTELEQLGKEQALGKAANLGCPRVETQNAITTRTSISQTTTIPRGSIKGFWATTTLSARS